VFVDLSQDRRSSGARWPNSHSGTQPADAATPPPAARPRRSPASLDVRRLLCVDVLVAKQHGTGDNTAARRRRCAQACGPASSAKLGQSWWRARFADNQRRDKLLASIPKEPVMDIGEEQEEFEILPAEEEQQPVVLPEREPGRQPEDVPA
jgi:hypothetical protein